ncbi:c-type cytochrome [Vibrio sp. SCSIO 43137]|uniref:c-type cytochrome n=1 Tax=Vibrio sp. SCSIO 43137 TaxID=3021011 RepID=UPI002307DCE9|nr:cytochrome c [Vibrio sp. SCSIO 43137]WCE32225.1 cytochrome c [Vibrio sp. SCSIO 43137]
MKSLFKTAAISLILMSSTSYVQAGIAQTGISNGKTKYTQYCQVCHGVSGHGDGTAAATLPNQPSNIAKKLNKLFASKEKLAGKVLNGKVDKGMPAWNGILSKQDTLDIFAYIQSVQ